VTESLVKEHFFDPGEVEELMLDGVQLHDIKTPMPQRALFPVRQRGAQDVTLSSLMPAPKFR